MHKRIFNILILLLFALLLQGGWGRAQDVLIVPHDATSLTEEQKNSNPTILFYPLHMMGKMPEMRCYVEEEDDYVDLGLSVLWAICNVGATTPEQYGDYFAWGETEPKEVYDWSTYKWCNGSYSTLTKYNNSTNGTMDNKTTLDLSDDAARANLGGRWRMPTKAEQDELREQCTWTWTTQNGVNGYTITGPNGNSIFLPAAGYRDGSSLYEAGSRGYYWSNSLYTGGPNFAYDLYFYSDNMGWGSYGRCVGFSVRPVRQ